MFFEHVLEYDIFNKNKQIEFISKTRPTNFNQWVGLLSIASAIGETELWLSDHISSLF